MPEELWTEVCDIVQETLIRTIPKKKKCKKAKCLWRPYKWLRKEEKRKAKEKRKDIPILNAKYQRIARRNKTTFQSEQCKETEENNRMGKTRDLFKKIRYQGNVSCKDGHNKGQKWYGPNRDRRY